MSDYLYDYKNKQTDNSRNGHSKKTIQSSQGEIELKIPRDRNGEFEPELVKKHQMDISGIEDKILFMYSQGTSTRDIEKAMMEMYGIENAAYPKTEVQRCIIHQIRNSTRYVSYKDLKAFTVDLKPIYKATDL